jgi:hypothetical protein
MVSLVLMLIVDLIKIFVPSLIDVISNIGPKAELKLLLVFKMFMASQYFKG